MSQRSVIISIAVGIATLALAGSAWAQVIVHPNQIVGTIGFSNTSPAMLDLLEDAPGQALGMQNLVIRTESLDKTLRARASGPADSRLTSAYEISVESGPPGADIAYLVDVSAAMGASGTGVYGFDPLVSDPVEQEPAPDVHVDLLECAGAFRVKFIDSVTLLPVEVDHSHMVAYYEDVPGSGSFDRWQGWSRVDGPGNEIMQIVRGNGKRYRFTLTFETGTDPYWDELRWQSAPEANIDCEQIVEITVPVSFPETDPTDPHDDDHRHDPNDPNDPWHGDPRLGRILGEIDMIGEFEHNFASAKFSQVSAKEGPFTNRRIDWVNWSPSSGAFELPNVMPSNFASPPVNYSIVGEMMFRLGRRLNHFISPRLNLSDRVSVFASQTTNVGDLLVFDPGYLNGDILLAGPPIIPSPFENLVRSSDTDIDADGLPDKWYGYIPNSTIAFASFDELTIGDPLHRNSGSARSIFEGEYNPASNSFEGDYEVVLGGVHRTDSFWTLQGISADLVNTSTPSIPESYQDCHVGVGPTFSGHSPIPRGPHEIAISPGKTETRNQHYCFGQLYLRFTAVGGVFTRPSVAGSGTFSGLDFELNDVDQSLGVSADGTPLVTPADEGLVVLTLPQGSYELGPQVTIHDPLGGTSRVWLTDLPFEMGCKHVYDVWLDFYFNLVQPACTADPISTIDGDVVSTEPVASIEYSLNGGPPVNVCTSCGIAPTFSFDVTLDPGPNTIVVTAIEEVTLRRAVTTITQTLNNAPLPDYGNVLLAVEEGNDVHLHWQTPPSANVTQLARADEKTFSAPVGIATVDALTLEFIDVDVKPPVAGTELYYQVRGLDCGGTPGP